MEQNLCIDLAGYWHSGSGRSAGTHLDALTEKDSHGLPFVAGKQLKGLLRHALHRAIAWQWVSPAVPDGPAVDLETLLFGSRSHIQSRHATLPGMLIIGDATLKDAEYLYLQQTPELSSFLYETLYSTAINEKGTAKDGSLRGIEVTLPVKLFSALQLTITSVDNAHRAQQKAWLSQVNEHWFWLEVCLPLIDAVGAHRSRGLGEATLSLIGSSKDIQP